MQCYHMAARAVNGLTFVTTDCMHDGNAWKNLYIINFSTILLVF